MMIYRRIADSILSHKRTYKSIKALDKVALRHIIALSPRPYPKHNCLLAWQAYRKCSLFQVRFFILAHIFMKEDYYEKK